MKVKHLLEKLHNLDREAEVVVYGYEGGMASVTQCDEILIAFNTDTTRYGSHEEVLTKENDTHSFTIQPAVKLW